MAHLVSAKPNKWAVQAGKPRGDTVWRRPCPHVPAFLSCSKNNFPSSHRCISNHCTKGCRCLPSLQKMTWFFSDTEQHHLPTVLQRGHKPGHQEPCIRGVFLPCTPPSSMLRQTECVCSLSVYRNISVADEPIPTCLSSLLPTCGDPSSPQERQPVSLQLPKEVTESCFQHKQLFR